MSLAATLAQPITQPQYLIEVLFQSLTLRYSTRGTVEWNSQSWLGEAGAEVANITKNKDGSQTARITLPNQSLAISAIVLNEAIADQPVRIWKAYGEGTITSAYVTQVFEGVIDSAPAIGERVELNLISENVFNQFSPRLRCGPPLMNYIPPTGTIIKWGGDIYELERR